MGRSLDSDREQWSGECGSIVIASLFFLLCRKKTTEKLCSLLMSKACISDDLPPNELPNPNPETYSSDLISIQDLLLAGKVAK